MKRGTGLIVALDEINVHQAIELSRTLKMADALKVGYPFVLRNDMGMVRDLASRNKVVCDFKVADIPNTNRQIVEEAFKSGASAVIVHAFTGRDSLKQCIKTANDFGGEIFCIVEMSHPGSKQFMDKSTDEMAKMVVEEGAHGVIAPGNKPNRIRHIRSMVGDLQIMAPGIGKQGGNAREAIDAGADFVIVGRSICQALKPLDVARKIVAEIGK
jgi:orotidine-5'-phosphate decarboxylase